MPIELLKTRRTNLRRTPSGIFYVHAKVGGRLIRSSLKTTIESVALERMGKILAEARGVVARPDSASRMTLADAVTAYLARRAIKVRAGELTKAGWRARENTIRRLNGGSILVSALNEAHADSITKELSGYSPGYRNQIFWLMRCSLMMCRKDGLMTRDPSDWFKRERVVQRGKIMPKPDEVERLVESMKTARQNPDGLWKFCRFLALSGARLTEATELRWENISFERGQIHFEKTKYGNMRREPRILPLLPELREHLELVRDQAETRTGKVFNVKNAIYIIKAMARRLGICEGFGHHSFRHFFATRAIESGVDIPTVSRWLGHQDGGVLLMKTYGHLRDEHSREAAKRVRVF